MADCNSCEHKKRTAEPKTIPYGAYELEKDHIKYIITWLLSIIIIQLCIIIGGIVGFIVYESQFETVESTSEAYNLDADNGGNAIINGEGSVSVNDKD